MRRGGSSPLARGTHLDPPAKGGFFGLIPARAGNTRHAPPKAPHYGAHPRSRGEHQRQGCLGAAVEGSSPLARGTLKLFQAGHCGEGLIPARAGNTDVTYCDDLIIWAHPRSRGEHLTLQILKSHSPGSSPLARGTPDPTTQLVV